MALPLPRPVLQGASKVVVVLDSAEAKLLLEGLLRLVVVAQQDAVDVLDDLGHVRAAVGGHALLHGRKVLPLARICQRPTTT